MPRSFSNNVFITRTICVIQGVFAQETDLDEKLIAVFFKLKVLSCLLIFNSNLKSVESFLNWLLCSPMLVMVVL